MNEQRIKLLKQYIEKEPDNPFNKYALAMEYYDSLPEESISLLESLLQMHSEYLPTYFKAANLFWELEQMDKADEVFRKGIELANQQQDLKALQELKASYQNFEFERD